tara:strand:- start:3030 stop:3407 length:378 start_codon:yes stop_codon:yes gene_type:complete
MPKHPYYNWEDYLNGMYGDECQFSENESKNIITRVMSSETEFIKIGKEVVDNWVLASEEFLSNKNTNRRSWVGQAICSYKYGINEKITKKVWKSLTPIIRDVANNSADIVISYYDNSNRERGFFD